MTIDHGPAQPDRPEERGQSAVGKVDAAHGAAERMLAIERDLGQLGSERELHPQEDTYRAEIEKIRTSPLADERGDVTQPRQDNIQTMINESNLPTELLQRNQDAPDARMPTIPAHESDRVSNGPSWAYEVNIDGQPMIDGTPLSRLHESLRALQPGDYPTAHDLTKAHERGTEIGRTAAEKPFGDRLNAMADMINKFIAEAPGAGQGDALHAVESAVAAAPAMFRDGSGMAQISDGGTIVVPPASPAQLDMILINRAGEIRLARVEGGWTYDPAGLQYKFTPFSDRQRQG